MMISDKKKRERQRIAWLSLLVSFSVCVIVTIAIPVAANSALQNSTELLSVLLQANQGTVGIDNESSGRRALLAGDPGQLIGPAESVLTGGTATALLTVTPPDSEQLLARLQIYSNTDIRLLQADTPRFAVSNEAHALSFRLDNGRLRLSVPQFEARPLLVTISTPQGVVTVDQLGQYAIVVTNEEMQVTVQEGELTVANTEQTASLALAGGERGVVPTGADPVGPLPPERNLVTNGNFTSGTDAWTIFPWTVERADQPAGQIRVLTEGGEARLNVSRQGVGHADVLLRQSINQDVAELESLRLLLTFRIINQELGVCGVQGSECPLFVRINYVDEAGLSNTWQHGFYAVGEVVPGETPDACLRCAVVQGTHERVPLQQDYFYDVDLGEEIARQVRLPPRFIESIILVSSGHSFEVEVVEVALLAEE